MKSGSLGGALAVAILEPITMPATSHTSAKTEMITATGNMFLIVVLLVV